MTESQKDKDFANQAKALFDDSVERLDGATLSRLNQGRHKALEELPKHLGHPFVQPLLTEKIAEELIPREFRKAQWEEQRMPYSQTSHPGFPENQLLPAHETPTGRCSIHLP